MGNLWVIHMVGNKRPELESYKYDMPGEETVSQPELLIYDLEERRLVEVAMPEEWKDHRLSQTSARQFRYPDSEEPFRTLWLSPNSDELHFVRQSRDQHRVDVMVAEAATGESRVLFEERLNTYVEFQRLELLESGDMLWWSERDGWAHLYRFGPDGSLRNRLTEGPWSVRQVVGLDEAAGVVYFQANAREVGEDPYYQHLYRVNLDGSGLTRLNPGDFDHRVDMGESNRFFVNNYSRVDETPASALHAANGRRIMDLEIADFSKLEEAGYGFPEPYRVKADDGVTDLYGVMYKPFDFDPEKTYPIVAYVYPGAADGVRRQVVLDGALRDGAGPVRDGGDHGGEPRRPPGAIEVVPQLRVREPPGLRAGGQESRDRTTRRPARFHRHRPGGDLRPLGGRVHVHGGDAGLPGFLQGRGLILGEPQQRRLQPRTGRRSTTACVRSSTTAET